MLTSNAPTTEKAARQFRPDIQALRAVAVSVVVVYHLWPERLPGGFVGVDVFFVISGFLITQHLVSEVTRTGSISLSHFWARRIRRLLPAAFVVLAASLVVLLVLMPRVTWQNNLLGIAGSAAYVENWILAYQAVDYLAAENTATLVQHYWSLSVEEQFYLVWPLLLIGFFAVGRVFRRTGGRSPAIIALVVVAVSSFVASVLMTAALPAQAFFATPTRMWEFAVGGLLATVPFVKSRFGAPWLRASSSWVGLGILVFSVFFITGSQPFPGIIAIVPVAGAAMVLFGGTASVRWSPAKLAALRPVQWLGDQSYSLYLWHWPLIVAAPWLLHGPTNWASKLVILAASLLLAWLTKRFIEDPARAHRWWSTRRVSTYSFAAAGTVLLLVLTSGFYLAVQRSNRTAESQALVMVTSNASCFGAKAIIDEADCAAPFARTANLDTAFAASDTGGDDQCQPGQNASNLVLCTYGETTNPIRTIVVVGSSHALRLMPALDLYGKAHGWEVVVAAKTACMGLSTTPVGDQDPDSTCFTWTAKLKQHLMEMPQLDAVIFASYSGSEEFLAGTNPTASDIQKAGERVTGTWEELGSRGAKVIVTEDVPGMRPDPDPECVAQSTVSYDPCALPRASVLVPNLVSDLAQANPDLVSYVHTSQYFCDAEYCHAVIGGVVVYSDAHHITATYSRSLGQYLGADIDAIVSKHS